MPKQLSFSKHFLKVDSRPGGTCPGSGVGYGLECHGAQRSQAGVTEHCPGNWGVLPEGSGLWKGLSGRGQHRLAGGRQSGVKLL